MGRRINTVGICVCFLSALYLTLILYKFDIFSSFAAGCLILFYWMILFVFWGRWIQKGLRKNWIFRKVFYIISAVFTVFLLSFCGEAVLLRFQMENKIEIVATGEKNEAANAAEVWLVKVEVDGKDIDITEISPDNGWYYKDALVSYPVDTPLVQTINLIENGETRLVFVKHSWSGKVLVKRGGITRQIDLYSVGSEEYVCEFENNIYQFWLLDIWSLVNVFVIVFCLGLSICLAGVKFHLQDYLRQVFLWYKDKKLIEKLLIWLVDLLICFQYVGAKWYLAESNDHLLNCLRFACLAMFGIPVLISVWMGLEKFERWLFSEKGKELGRGHRATGRGKIFLLVVSILLSLPFWVGMKEVFFTSYPEGCTVSIIPTGEKSEDSSGTEILLGGVSVNGIQYEPEQFTELPQGWENRNGMLFGLSDTPLELKINEPGEVYISFNKHPWSGIVEIQDQEKIERFDLYAEAGAASYIFTYHVTGNQKVQISLGIILVMMFAVCFLTAVIYFILNKFREIWYGEESKRVFPICVFGIEMLIFLFYILASYPASICVDGRTQLYQALGVEKLTDAHPAFHTMLVKLFTLNGKFLAGFPIMQALGLSGLSTAILNYFYKRNFNRKILLIFAVCSAASVTNGIYVTTIWKDVMYSYCLLWLTYLLFRMEGEQDYILNKLNPFKVAAVLSLVRLLRHNGVVVLIGIAVLFAVWTFTRKKAAYLFSLLLSFLIVIGIREMVYPIWDVRPVNAASGISSLVHGIVYAGISGDIPVETGKMLADIMPLEEWEKCYSKYSANELYMSPVAVANQVGEKVSALGTGKIVKEYLRTFFHCPYKIIEDRLYGIDIMWNIVQDNGYNWRCANDTYEIGIVANDMGWYRKNNIATKIVGQLYQKSSGNWVFDAIFWRAGFGVSALMVFICYGYFSRKKQWVFYLPVLLNILSLCIAMAWQDFRYVYFVNLCVPYLGLMCLALPGWGSRGNCLVFTETGKDGVSEDMAGEVIESEGEGGI